MPHASWLIDSRSPRPLSCASRTSRHCWAIRASTTFFRFLSQSSPRCLHHSRVSSPALPSKKEGRGKEGGGGYGVEYFVVLYRSANFDTGESSKITGLLQKGYTCSRGTIFLLANFSAPKYYWCIQQQVPECIEDTRVRGGAKDQEHAEPLGKAGALTKGNNGLRWSTGASMCKKQHFRSENATF